MNTADVLILAAVAVGAYLIYQKVSAPPAPVNSVATIATGIGGLLTGISSLASGVYGEIAQNSQSGAQY